MLSVGNILIVLTLGWSLLRQTHSQGSRVVFYLQEEQKANTFVGDVAKVSGIQSQVVAGDVQKLRYQIFGSDDLKVASLFIIHSHSGLLYTNAMIDREKVCEAAAINCSLEFDVTAKVETSVVKILRVAVIIEDINDNAPMFPNKSLHLSVSEAYTKGSDFSVPGASDPDTQAGTEIMYWMEDSPVFELQKTKLLDVFLLKLVLLQDLDRENKSEYHLRIYAKDGDTDSALTGTVSVTITVTDVNDNSPQFTPSSFNFSVPEDADIGTVIGSLQATDLDAGDNGRITYTFSSLTSSKVLQLFNIHPDTGNVSVKSLLQYESGRTFKEVVVANDHGESPKTSHTILQINVLDVGNTPPQVSLILAAPMHINMTVMAEDLPVDSFVGRLRYRDNDEGDNGVVECVSLNPYFALVPVEEQGFSIKTKSALDRETDNIMDVVLKCSDQGSPSLSTFVNFTVHVSDVNDNSPVFMVSDYSAAVRENQVSQKNVIQVSASDADEGTNRQMTYHLTVNSSNSFSIDPFTGWIALNSPVDREIDPVIYLVVEAVDKGKPSLTGSTTVTIFVDDVNDNSPRVTRTEYQVKENEEAGVFVGQVLAADGDDGDNGKLTFQMASDPTRSFNVSRSGMITTSRTFDRETVSYYSIVVAVSDSGTPSLTSTATLTISITDTNDHSPQILYPWPGNDSLTLNADASPGTVIATVSAIDLDTQRNAQLLYLIAEGNPRQVFGMDNSTGSIFLTKRLTTSRDTFYRLTISVQDGGNPRRHNNTFLYVKVDFTNASFIDSVSEMEQKYTIIAGVISGVTLIVAVTIIAIIFKLRRMDSTQPAHVAPKLKDTAFVGTENKHTPEVALNHMSTFYIRSPKEASFLNDANQDGCLNTSVSLIDGGQSGNHKVKLSQEILDQHHGSYFQVPQGRQRQTSEDVHSDSSADATGSDSGKGTSDVEDISCAVSLSSGASPAPRLPLKGPALASLSSSPYRPNHLFTRDSNSMGDLSRAARVQMPQKETDAAQRTPSKVRFSFDDHNINNQRRLQPSHNVQDTNGRVLRAHHSAFNDDRKKPLLDSYKSFPAKGNVAPPQTSHRQQMHGRHNNREVVDPPSAVSSFLMSREALLKHNSQLQPDLNQQQPDLASQHSLLPHYSQQQQHHHQQQQQQQQSYNPLMSSLNASTDEDDDILSTTTSGSYAIDDPVSTTVEC